MQLFFSNPGDYAWGREGLDAIVTQLLNQMDTTGTTLFFNYNNNSGYFMLSYFQFQSIDYSGR